MRHAILPPMRIAGFTRFAHFRSAARLYRSDQPRSMPESGSGSLGHGLSVRWRATDRR